MGALTDSPTDRSWVAIRGLMFSGTCKIVFNICVIECG